VAVLTSQHVRDIFARKDKSCLEVGGPSAPIHLFTRDETSGTRETFCDKLLQKDPIDAKANILASNGVMKLALARDTQAIGYLGIGLVFLKGRA